MTTPQTPLYCVASLKLIFINLQTWYFSFFSVGENTPEPQMERGATAASKNSRERRKKPGTEWAWLAEKANAEKKLEEK